MLSKRYKYIIYLLFLLSRTVFLQKIGHHDLKICKSKSKNHLTGSSLSCTHQLPIYIRNHSSCDIKLPEICSPYKINHDYDPFKLPFKLDLYQFSLEIVKRLALNISFSNPAWTSMDFLIQSKLYPQEKQLCRRYQLHNVTTSMENATLYFDCLLFEAENLEGQNYALYLIDSYKWGGVYQFKVPTMRHFNASTSINDWHVFFFIHSHMDSKDKLFVTIQLAPFLDVSYSVSSVKCINTGLMCENGTTVTLETVILNHTHFQFQDILNIDAQITTFVKKATEPGVYAVVVEILSSECEKSGCDLSVSPTYEIKANYGVTIAFSLLAILIAISLASYFIFRKIHQSFLNHLDLKKVSPDSVLIVYHAHSQEYLELIRYLSFVLNNHINVRTLMVDENVGTGDPDEWTRNQLTKATKVLFIAPNSLSTESITPVKHQWLCATKYFSGSYFKRQENVSSRCASVIFPNSCPIIKGSEIYSLSRYYLPDGLFSLADWLHRRSIVDRLIFWPSIAKKERQTLSSFINYSAQPSVFPKPQVGATTTCQDKIQVSLEETVSRTSLSEIDDDDNEHIDKVQKEFDPLIPDIRNIDSDSDAESFGGSSSETSDSDDSSNVLNYIE